MVRKDNYTLPGAKGRPMLIDVTYEDALKNAPVVIFAHGFKGFKDWGTHNLVADYFARNGFRYLKFNFSHNGTTPDHPTDFADLIAFSDNTFSIELEDLDTIIDFACSGSGMAAANGVFLIGHSMGGGISIIKSAEDRRIKKLVTMASISGFRNLWPQQSEAQWYLQGVIYMHNSRTGQQMPLKSTLLDDLDKHPLRLNIQAKAAEVQQPWLLVHGDIDPTVPLDHAKELHTAQPKAELVIIKGGDHVLGASHPYTGDTLPTSLQGFCDRTIAFFNY
ncbi:Alpha/beta hydrolase family protein [Mucilaginibacter lappiensis]|uniref:Pimeloyl-ACP methyl ester carboxylesterase n=1 Tax=Mucilaginibacter lappiensis TaxID=354630 RepID=A0ABR6PMH6_9SPHI|nr:alpha/beta fold hydrolase [Mucilaginibacter lappiensis]MBB6110974.1 pimeloyl-ACP methyl ester carboxylesterase [Mucilaginibacter lappiensis]SIR59163.1 Alpha/beta hydrolase family protein [Mucilaginibacter lappiensis]